jgi:hypothetical protein
MAKVRVTGDVNFEFDVKFNQTEDVVIEAKAVDIGNREKVYIGTGNIEKINPKSFSFIASRIEHFLKKNNAYTDIPLAVGRGKDKIVDKMIDQGLGFLLDAMLGSKTAVDEMLNKKLFLLNESGMRFYLKKYFEKNK